MTLRALNLRVLPSFGRGIREVKVVAVGSEYAAVYVCSGRVVGGRTHEVLDVAIALAREASDPPEYESDDPDDVGF